jgi:CarboxypepD_reg-like domain
MKKFILFLALFFSVENTLFSQHKNLIINGLVFSKNTKKAIIQASVRVGKVGVMTNEDGRFSLKIKDYNSHSKLLISSIGFKNIEIILPKSDSIVSFFLEESIQELSEITVHSSAKGIIKDAIGRITMNYPQKPTKLTGFFRESNILNNTQYDYISEAVEQIYKPSYLKKNEGEVKILQNRKKEFVKRDSLKLKVLGYPRIAIIDDIVQRRQFCLDNSKIDNYQYKLEEISTYNNASIYIIDFSPIIKDSTKSEDEIVGVKGKIYITTDSLAIVRIDIETLAKSLKKDSNFNIKYTQKNTKTQYQESNGQWYLQSVLYDVSFTFKGSLHHLKAEYITTDIDDSAGVMPFEKNEIFKHNDDFLREQKAEDKDFWQSYNAIVRSEALSIFINDKERQKKSSEVFK